MYFFLFCLCVLHVVSYVHPQFVLRCQHFLSTLFTLKTTQLTHGIVHNFYVLCLLVLCVFLFFFCCTLCSGWCSERWAKYIRNEVAFNFASHFCDCDAVSTFSVNGARVQLRVDDDQRHRLSAGGCSDTLCNRLVRNFIAPPSVGGATEIIYTIAICKWKLHRNGRCKWCPLIFLNEEYCFFLAKLIWICSVLVLVLLWLVAMTPPLPQPPNNFHAHSCHYKLASTDGA